MLSDVVDQIENRGKEKGLQQGHEERGRADATRMLRKGFSIDDVVEVTELSHEEVIELAKQVEQEES